jgi:hypothetical protein
MKNPEFAFARKFGASALPASVREDGSLAFEVDLPPSVADGANEVSCIATLAWADAKTPVAVLGICRGKLFLATALNPLDPSTRAFLRDVNRSGALPYSVTFDATADIPSSSVVRHEWLMHEEELFAEALRATEHMPSGDSERWTKLAAHAMAHCLVDEGFVERIRARLSVRTFNAFSAEMSPETAETSAFC